LFPVKAIGHGSRGGGDRDSFQPRSPTQRVDESRSPIEWPPPDHATAFLSGALIMRILSRFRTPPAFGGLALVTLASWSVGWLSTQAQQPQAGATATPQVDPASVVVRETGSQEPANHLYQFPNESLIQDEPLVVEVPLGHAQSFFNIGVPPSNPLTKGKLELGRQLYFDPRVSKDGTVSCASCHNPEKGWTDNLPTSTGIDGQIGGRNAPTVINTVYGKTMFWDGRAPSLEGQAQGPIQNPIEMGDQTYKEIIERLRQIPGYRDQFRKVFGTDVTLDGFAKAVATFERVAALSGNSAYDRYASGDHKALSDSAKRGMILFGLRLDSNDPDRAKFADVTLKKAECTSCHIGFNFTDEKFHNLGVGWDPKTRTFDDLGRWNAEPVGAKSNASLGAFKTPTMRDITRTAPYFHDGSAKTLEEVVEHYDKGGTPNPYLSKDMKRLNLTAQEKRDLVVFMEALTGETKPAALPTLPPGPDGTSPDPRSALGMGAKAAAAIHDFHPRVVAR
jgi:cytochrome c peroxidase